MKLTRKMMAEMAMNNFSSALAAGYSLSSALAAGYSLSSARAAGYSLSDARAAGYSLSSALAAGYSLSSALAAGYSLSSARAAGYSLSSALAAGYSLSDARAAGYSLSSALAAGYSLSDARAAGYSLSSALKSCPKIEKPYTQLWADINKKKRIHRQSTFGPDSDPETNLCGTPMCTAGHLVQMAGAKGYELAKKFGYPIAATIIAEKAHPEWPQQNYGTIPQEFALAFIEEMANREAAEK